MPCGVPSPLNRSIVHEFSPPCAIGDWNQSEYTF